MDSSCFLTIMQIVLIIAFLLLRPVDLCSAQKARDDEDRKQIRLDYHNSNEGTQQTGGFHMFAINFGAIKSSLIGLLILIIIIGLVVGLIWFCKAKIKALTRPKLPGFSMPHFNMPWNWQPPQFPSMPPMPWMWNRQQAMQQMAPAPAVMPPPPVVAAPSAVTQPLVIQAQPQVVQPPSPAYPTAPQYPIPPGI